MNQFYPYLRWILIYSSICFCIVLLFTAQMLIGTEAEWQQTFKHSLSRWSAWFILAPAVLWFTVRFPLLARHPDGSSRGWLRNALIHLLMSLVITMLVQVMFEKFFRQKQERPTETPTIAQSVTDEQQRRPGGEVPRWRERRPGPPRGESGPPRGQSLDEFPPGNRPSGDPASAENVSVKPSRPSERELGDRPRPPSRGEPGARPPRRPPPGGRPGRRSPLLVEAARQLQVGLPVYWAIVGIQSMLMFGRQLRQRELDSLELQTKLTNAQLETLRLQLQPHFLFNALNAVSTLVHRDPEKADEMIGHLSTLLRGALDDRDTNEVPLSRELELLRAYVDIEKVRFGDRIEFEESISPDCLHAKLPPLLLQPLVENAVRHGLEPLGRPGRLLLTAKRDEQRLCIRIEDSGVGRRESGKKGFGIGLSNANARLETLYGRDGYSLELADREGGGTVVLIELPFDVAD